MHLAATLAPNEDIAFMGSIIWTAINLLFSGFFVTITEMPFAGMHFLEYITAFFYGFEALMTIEFKGRTRSCRDGVIPNGMGPLLPVLFPDTTFVSYTAQLNSTSANGGKECIVDPNAVLTYFGFTRPFGVSVAILAGYWLGLHVLTFIAMTIVARRERR